MNAQTIALISIRGLASLFGLQGNAPAALALNKLATLMESGQHVDAHLQAVADAMKAGTPNAWADVNARIEADSDRLQRP